MLRWSCFPMGHRWFSLCSADAWNPAWPPWCSLPSGASPPACTCFNVARSASWSTPDTRRICGSCSNSWLRKNLSSPRCGAKRPAPLSNPLHQDRPTAPGSICRSCTAVFQHPVHYPASLYENVALAAASRAVPAQVQEVLEKAGLTGLAAAPNELLGPEFRGIDLSGGQWQRLAIARALF